MNKLFILFGILFMLLSIFMIYSGFRWRYLMTCPSEEFTREQLEQIYDKKYPKSFW